MRWIRSNTVQSMFALWLVYLLFLIVMYTVDPQDPWNQMLHRPVFLIFAPLLVACIPWVGTKPAENQTDLDESRDYLRHRSGFVIPDKARRAAAVWLVALAVFGSPLGPRYSYLVPVLHQPVFLLFAPLLLACVSLLLPGTVPVRTDVVPEAPRLSRSRVWSGIVACLMITAILVGLLVLINDPSLMGGSANAYWPNVLYSCCIVAAVWRIWYLVRLLKTAR